MTTLQSPDDDFLSAGRARPRPAFAQALYRRISQPPLPKPVGRFTMTTMTRFFPQRLALGLLAGVAALGLFLAASPVARAQLAGVLRVVGGVTYNEVDPQPGPAPAGEPGTVPSQTLPLAEAQASLPFALDLPAWAPAGFILQDDVVVESFPNGPTFARVAWYSDTGRVIDLRVEHPGTATWEVGPDSLEETTVNGAPAAILRGMWNADTGAWERSSAVILSWRHGDATYHLSSSDGSTNPQVLVQMAESIP